MLSSIITAATALWLVYVPGPDALSRAKAASVVRVATQQLELSNVKIKRQRILSARDYASYITPYQQEGLWQNYREYARRRGWSRKGRMVHFVTPPYHYEDQKYFGGVATAGCVNRRGPISISTASRYRSNGMSALGHSVTVAAHEMAHTLGAGHINTLPNLMHSAALQFVRNEYPLPLDERTRRQIRACLTSN